MQRYNPSEIESKWQQIWDDTQVYRADLDSDKPKYIAMSMFNYPSGAGIHIGHAMNYTISDVMARFKRQQGYESYHPVGWDAFGLPAENFAIKSGISPQVSMAKIIPSYHTQYKAMGWSNDWSKEISTHLPEYYKWTQWIFAEMFRAGLAYQEPRMQWWCAKCQTVLANEQVIDGKCWRHDSADDPEVAKKEVKQWFFKVTEYADEMLEATDALDWSEVVKSAQKNWIGKSQGAEIDFAVDEEIKPNFIILHGYTGRADKNWLPWLSDVLTSRGFKVQTPQMPNTDNPVEEEQVSYVLKNCLFDENTVLIGHSLGGAVAMKVLEKLNRQIRQLVLIAPVVEPAFRGPDYRTEKKRTFIGTFDLSYDYEAIKSKAAKRLVLSENAEAKKRKPYLQYLADKIYAPLLEADGNKIHFTAEQEPFILQSLFLSVPIFTTRPDTIFGATFLVLAPEHELVSRIVTDDARDVVENYVKQALKKSELERQETKEKTGVPTGAHAINPATGEKIPIWVADYVLSGYGTGAIMAVPAHDERDFEFAEKFQLPIAQVVAAYAEYTEGPSAVREEVEQIERPVIDAIIRREDGKYLLQIEDEHVHFVGGGIDAEDATTEDAIRREVLEETGYTDIASIRQVAPFSAVNGYRHTKNKNQRTWGAFYEVVLASDNQVASEIDEGKHTVEWVEKSKVANRITWKAHLQGWNAYLNNVIHDLHIGEGVLVNSGAFDGKFTSEAREEIVAWCEEQGIGKSQTTYKIRDWSVSRQRYWGAPIPIVYCPKDGAVLVPDDQLPVVLPELDDFQPSGDGRSALARATDWLHTTCPKCGGPAERETDTLDTYICSSWYFLRYFDPQNFDKAFESRVANKWMPIDFYNGGDHATAHMIYARFMTRFFWHQGLLENPEPFKKFLFNGKVTASDGTMFSKSKGNGVDPLEIIHQGYGADALRTYLMFAAPLEQWMRWDPQGVPGTYRFLSRVWNLVQEFINSDKNAESNDDVLHVIHPTIKKVTADLEEQKYNTAIAAMMETTNKLYTLKKSGFDEQNWQFALESLVALVAPFAPHLADELWHHLGRETSVQRDSWPEWDKKYLLGDTLTIVVQVNGKVRAKLEVTKDTAEDEIKQKALADENVQKFVGSQKPAKVIYVPGRLVNVVV